jgi:tight junction protein 1
MKLLAEQPAKVPNYFLYEQHNVTLMRSAQYGYGLAISGGLDASNPDAAIYVSDVVRHGPAEDKLQPGDRLLTVNGVSVEAVEHSFAIRLLKEAKEFIHLVVKRRLNNELASKEAVAKHEEALQPSAISTIRKRCNQAILHTANTLLDNFNASETAASDHADYCKSAPVPLLKPIKVTLSRKDKREGFGLVLGCKFYIKEILPESVAAAEANLRKGDVLLRLNDLGMEQLSLGEANKILVKSGKLHVSVKRNSLATDSEASSEFGGSDDVASSCSGPPKTEDTCDKAPSSCYQLSAKQLFKPIGDESHSK